MCAKDFDLLPLSAIFLLNFVTVPGETYFCIFIVPLFFH